MSAPFQPHWDILAAAQKALCSDLAPSRALGYVLYGGTAIALHLGHRVSVDFDFFTERPLDEAAPRTLLTQAASAVRDLPAMTLMSTVLAGLPESNRPSP